MATKLAFPGFEKENSATFTVDNVTHQFTQDHKGLTRGFIFAYMGLSRMQINTCDRAIRAAIMADSTLAPPGNLEETVKFAWDKHNEAVHEARYKLQSSLLNGGSAVECSGLFQQRNNQSGRPEWYREDWLYTQASDDPGFLSSMLQQLLLMEVARIRREAKRDFDKEVKAAGTAALARGSGKRPITSTAAALIAGQPGQGRGRASSSTRSRGASRARSSNRRSMSSARNSTSGLSDGAGDMHLEEASDTEMMDVKKELKDQLVVFVWVNVLDPEAGQATLISSAPVRLDSFFNGSEGLTSMTDLAGFRYELKRSCLRKPRLALADLHAGLYSTRSDSFWPLKLVDEEVDAEDQEFEARAVKKQFAGLFQQFWQEATSTIEVIQVFVAAERAHFELIPKDECSLNRGIPDTRELNFTTKSEASEFDSQNSPLGPSNASRPPKKPSNKSLGKRPECRFPLTATVRRARGAEVYAPGILLDLHPTKTNPLSHLPSLQMTTANSPGHLSTLERTAMDTSSQVPRLEMAETNPPRNLSTPMSWLVMLLILPGASQ
jgi:hypothetical protein